LPRTLPKSFLVNTFRHIRRLAAPVSILTVTLLAQLAAASLPAMRPSPAVLAFPEPGLDDSVAYAGYTTRFFRGADRNTVQIYLDRREGRVVHLFANGENESIGFSARTASGEAAPVHWHAATALVGRQGRRKLLTYDLDIAAPALHLGRFIFGSMRVERDGQHYKEHRKPFSDPPYALPEFVALAEALESHPPASRRAALALLRAPDLPALRTRLAPALVRAGGPPGNAVVEQPSLDGLDTLRLVFAPGEGTSLVSAGDREVVFRAGPSGPLHLRVTISTTGQSLTPLTRGEIFTDDFLAWTREVDAAGDATRARWTDRQITGVELLASREKLMAGLPTYATYFGRDMLLSALMMQPVWRPEMTEFVIAAALRKLSPAGEVSHEEALGGQALREAAAEAAGLLRGASSATGAKADSLRAAALRVLRARRATRENYHMVDDEYQLPLLVARYLDDARLPDARKRAWLLARDGGRTRLALLLAELSVVADRSAPYAAEPARRNLVAFAPREATATAYDGAPRWFAQSWRDSGAGYANGKYAMDVNAVYVPHALEAMQRILSRLRTWGWLTAATLPLLREASPLARYARDSSALAAAISTWRSAEREFVVRLSPAEVQRRVAARVAALPADERAYWRAFPPSGEGLEFPALALDADGAPIAVVNSDPATRLFLDGLMGGGAADTTAQRRALHRDVSLFAREYPEGLLIPGVGAVVANDAFAPPAVWNAFAEDGYHGPKVVWGREVNLFLLGVASHLPLVRDDMGAADSLRQAAARVRNAVAASGFRNELWSYAFPTGRPQPIRYGSGGDVQLWSTTDLAVQYVWARLPH
jgi:membrane-bound inhibitor of C-type lysozyme